MSKRMGSGHNLKHRTIEVFMGGFGTPAVQVLPEMIDGSMRRIMTMDIHARGHCQL